MQLVTTLSHSTWMPAVPRLTACAEGTARTPAPTGLVRDVANALASLPVHYREIILLRDLEGHTIAEIASALSLHPEAAKARLHRARSLTRQYLNAQPVAQVQVLAVPR